MILAEIVDQVVIDSRKLTRYALNPHSPSGQHKARVFESTLGFTLENSTQLMHQLEQKALHTEITIHSTDEFGIRYTADIAVKGLHGQSATVRTGWLVSPGTRTAHLVTLYVKRR